MLVGFYEDKNSKGVSNVEQEAELLSQDDFDGRIQP